MGKNWKEKTWFYVDQSGTSSPGFNLHQRLLSKAPPPRIRARDQPWLRKYMYLHMYVYICMYISCARSSLCFDATITGQASNFFRFSFSPTALCQNSCLWYKVGPYFVDGALKVLQTGHLECWRQRTSQSI